jgi:hypothetical protein
VGELKLPPYIYKKKGGDVQTYETKWRDPLTRNVIYIGCFPSIDAALAAQARARATAANGGADPEAANSSISADPRPVFDAATPMLDSMGSGDDNDSLSAALSLFGSSQCVGCSKDTVIPFPVRDGVNKFECPPLCDTCSRQLPLRDGIFVAAYHDEFEAGDQLTNFGAGRLHVSRVLEVLSDGTLHLDWLVPAGKDPSNEIFFEAFHTRYQEEKEFQKFHADRDTVLLLAGYRCETTKITEIFNEIDRAGTRLRVKSKTMAAVANMMPDTPRLDPAPARLSTGLARKLGKAQCLQI